MLQGHSAPANGRTLARRATAAARLLHTLCFGIVAQPAVKEDAGSGCDDPWSASRWRRLTRGGAVDPAWLTGALKYLRGAFASWWPAGHARGTTSDSVRGGGRSSCPMVLQFVIEELGPLPRCGVLPDPKLLHWALRTHAGCWTIPLAVLDDGVLLQRQAAPPARPLHPQLVAALGVSRAARVAVARQCAGSPPLGRSASPPHRRPSPHSVVMHQPPTSRAVSGGGSGGGGSGSGIPAVASRSPPPTLASPPQPRALLAHDMGCASEYELLRVLGCGGFGRVVAARHRPTGRLVAIKIVPRHVLRKRRRADRAVTERQVWADLRAEPFIVTLHRSFRCMGRLWFVMDYCPGGELFFHLRRLGRFQEPAAAFYCAEVAMGLMALHRRGIAYRDLKPENVLLDADGHVQLADFGLAKRMSDCADGRAYSMCGSLDYMAPEMVTRSGHGPAVDLWALGCLAYEMLVGRPPFHGTMHRHLVLHRIRQAMVTFPQHLSAHAVSFIGQLLHRAPHARLGARDMNELLAHPWLTGHGITPEQLQRRSIPAPLQLLRRGRTNSLPATLSTRMAEPMCAANAGAAAAARTAVAAPAAVPPAASVLVPEPLLALATPPLPCALARSSTVPTLPLPVPSSDSSFGSGGSDCGDIAPVRDAGRLPSSAAHAAGSTRVCRATSDAGSGAVSDTSPLLTASTASAHRLGARTVSAVCLATDAAHTAAPLNHNACLAVVAAPLEPAVVHAAAPAVAAPAVAAPAVAAPAVAAPAVAVPAAAAPSPAQPSAFAPVSPSLSHVSSLPSPATGPQLPPLRSPPRPRLPPAYAALGTAPGATAGAAATPPTGRSRARTGSNGHRMSLDTSNFADEFTSLPVAALAGVASPALYLRDVSPCVGPPAAGRPGARWECEYDEDAVFQSFAFDDPPPPLHHASAPLS